MGNRLGRAAAACVLLGLLIGLAYLLGPAGVGGAVGSVGLRQAAAAEPATKPAKAKDASASIKSSSEEEEEEEVFLDPMGPNAACYVCHMTFIFEELSTVHLKEKVTCVECHGVSAAHANDEDIGATKPDKIYPRCRINASCRKCHEEHVAKPEKVIAQWIKIGSPKQEPLCTDCHGTHKIECPEPEEDDHAADATEGKTEK